jgi:N-methylhydantoinase A
VTDANAVLGRLRPDAFLGGGMTLDVNAARAAIARLAEPLGMSIEQTAEGILAIANEHMIRALRVMSVQRGHDPSDFQLCCFGGAGGLHLCQLADALGVPRALVPVHAGVLSALGMLVAPRQRQMSRTAQQLLSTADAATINLIAAELSLEGIAQLRAEKAGDEDCIAQQVSLDLRYQGQSYTLNVAWQGERKQAVEEVIHAFHCAHEQRFGHRLALPIERVNVRVALNATSHRPQLPTLTQQQPLAPSYALLHGIGEVAVYRRERLAVGQTIEGPALVTEQVSTTLIASGWQAKVDGYGNLLLKKIAA